MTDPAPPRIALLLLRLFVRGEAREFIEGDLREEYAQRVRAEKGRFATWWWFWGQSVASCVSCMTGPARTSRSREQRSPARRPTDNGGGLGGAPGRGLHSDIRYALRAVGRRPAFSLAVIAILAVGVGATTWVFSVADWLLIRPVPGVGAAADRLLLVRAEKPDGNYTGLSYPNLRDLEAGAPAIEALAGMAPAGVQVAGEGVEPKTLRAEAVTAGYFDLLEVPPYHGRLFSEQELRADEGSRIMVVSHRMWREDLRSDPEVVGRELVVNGVRHTVIGVATEGFQGIERAGRTDLWFPAALYSRLRHFPDGYDVAGRAFDPFMQSVARLASDATPEEAEAQLRDVMVRLVAEYPDANAIHEEYRPTVHPDIGTSPNFAQYLRRIVTVMFGVAGLLLVIACANVANLLVFRSARVQGDVAVRRAMGASRFRIVRQHLLEALILALVAGALGVGVAGGLSEIMVSSTGFVGFAELDRVPLDLRALLFSLAIAVSVPLVFALVPAVLSSRTEVAANLQASRPTGTPRRARLRGGLTVLQLALSLALGVGGLLLVRTIDELGRVDPGFESEGLLLFAADPEPQGYDREASGRFALALLDRARAIPEVRAATIARSEPLYPSGSWGRVVDAEPQGESKTIEIRYQWIGPDYFTTLGVPMLRGRGFELHEVDPGAGAAGEVVILNETLASELFGSVDVVGRTVTIDGYRERIDKRIVGVASDVRHDLRSPPAPILYEPLPNSWGSEATLLIRTEAAQEAVARKVRTALQVVDPNVPLFRSQSVQETIASRMGVERMLAGLLGILAVLASGLSAAGLYAIVAWTVSERTREIGIRIAMGAEPGRIVGWTVRGAVGLAIAGIILGYGASIWVARLLESRLFGVEPFDPVIWGSAAALMLAVAAAASAQPALRAVAVRPVEALRAE